jgi:hypothetical protein
MLSDPSQLLIEQAAGASYRQLADRHPISHETARRLVKQALDDLVLEVIVQLHTAWRDERDGKETAYPGFAIPNGDMRRRQAALSIFSRICDAPASARRPLQRRDKARVTWRRHAGRADLPART